MVARSAWGEMMKDKINKKSQSCDLSLFLKQQYNAL